MKSSSTNIDDWAKEEVESLVAEATNLVSITDVGEGMNGTDAARLVETGTRACKLVEDLYSSADTITVQIRDLIMQKDFSNAWRGFNNHVRSLLGILKTVERDIANNRVKKVRDLMRAEVFSDFLEMAEYLQTGGYKDAAAVIAGGVLENALRSLANKWGISVLNNKGKSLTISPLNAELCKTGAYNELVWRQIDSYAAVRNAAAHGKYNEYNKETVAEMIRYVIRFAEEY